MKEFDCPSRDEASLAALDAYIAGDWPIGHVVALRGIRLDDWTGAKVRWQKGPGSRFVAYLFTPRGDVPITPMRRART